MAIAKHKSRRSELRESRVLARRVQRGDRRAFELLYASYEGGLFRVAHRLTGSSEQAAALVEATFTRALATLPEDGLDSVDIGAHLYGTARSLSYERSGTRNGTGHASGNGHGNGSVHVNGTGGAHANGTALDVRRGEHASEVVAATARLAPRQRLTLALRDLEGRPDDEIALALGTDRPSVPALVARARLRLREELALATPTTGCAGHLADLSAYADGTLPAERRAALEAHLEECGDCRATLFALREAALRYRALPVPVPPGELSWRMAAALGAVGLQGRGRAVAPAATSRPPVNAPAPEAVPEPVPVPLPEPVPVPVPEPVPEPLPEPVPVPEARAALGDRQTAAAIAMAALVLIGIVVTILARDGGGSKPSAARPPAKTATVGTSAAGATPTQTAATPRVAPTLVAAAASGGRVRPATPRKLHHARAGSRVFPHRSLPVRRPARTRAGTPRTSTPVASTTTRSRPAVVKSPGSRAAAKAHPLPLPRIKRRVPLQVLPPSTPPPVITPASAPPAASGPPSSSDPTTTTST